MGKLFVEEVEFFTSMPNAEATTIVEVGCGTAELFSSAGDRFLFNLGVDISPSMIEVAGPLPA